MLNLEKVINGVTVEKIYNVLLRTLAIQGGLTKVEIGKQLVSIGTNDGSMFVGCKTCVLVQMKKKLDPYLVAMQCCAHCTNFAIQTLFLLSIVHHLEDLLQSLHSYFVRSPKKVLELQKLTTLLNTKGNKILQNVKTCWISMLFPCK